MEKKQGVAKETTQHKFKKRSRVQKVNEEAIKTEKKTQKIKSRYEPKSKNEKSVSLNSDSIFIEPAIVEKKVENIVSNTAFNVRPIEFEEIPPITPIKLESYFRYINSQYLKNGDPNLDKDISENFSKYLSESGSIGTILKKKNTLDMVSFLIFLNDAFKKNLMENFGKIIIVLLRILFPDIKSTLTIKEEKEILAEFGKYNIEIKNEQTTQTVGDVTYGILKKFKTFLDVELMKSKTESIEGSENNISGLEKSAKIFEPYFARINAISENANIPLKVSEKLEESTIKSVDKTSASENESNEIEKIKNKSVKTKKTEMKKAKGGKNKKHSNNVDSKERGKDNEVQNHEKNSVDDNSSTDSPSMSKNEKKETSKKEKSEKTHKNREEISNYKIKTSLQILKLKSKDPDRGRPIKRRKSDPNDNNKECEKQVKKNLISDVGGVKMREIKSEKSRIRPYSVIPKRGKENSPLIEGKNDRYKKITSLFVKNADKDNKKHNKKDKEKPSTIFNLMKDDCRMENLSSLENHCILPPTIICEINSISFKEQTKHADKLRISKFSNSDQIRYDLRYGAQFMDFKYLKEKNIQKIFKNITENNIKSLNEMRIEKLSEFKKNKEKPSDKELDCQIRNNSDTIEKTISSDAFVFNNEMIVKLISREKEVLVSLITIQPKEMEIRTSKAKFENYNMPSQHKNNNEVEKPNIKKLINSKKTDNKTSTEKTETESETEGEKETESEKESDIESECEKENEQEKEKEKQEEMRRRNLDNAKERNAFKLKNTHECFNRTKKYEVNGKLASQEKGENTDRDKNINKIPKVLKQKSHIVYDNHEEDCFDIENKKMEKKGIYLINIKNNDNEETNDSSDNEENSKPGIALEKALDINVKQLQQNIIMQNDLDKKFNEKKECRIKLKVVSDKNYLGIQNKEHFADLLGHESGSFFVVKAANNDYKIFINYKRKKIVMTHVSSIKGGGYHIYKENYIFNTIEELISHYNFHTLTAYYMQ